MRIIASRIARLEGAVRKKARRMVMIFASDREDTERQLEAMRMAGEYDDGDGLICLTGRAA